MIGFNVTMPLEGLIAGTDHRKWSEVHLAAQDETPIKHKSTRYRIQVQRIGVWYATSQVDIC